MTGKHLTEAETRAAWTIATTLMAIEASADGAELPRNPLDWTEALYRGASIVASMRLLLDGDGMDFHGPPTVTEGGGRGARVWEGRLMRRSDGTLYVTSPDSRATGG